LSEFEACSSCDINENNKIEAEIENDLYHCHKPTWYRGTPVVNLLCDDFCGSLKQNVSSAHLCFHRRVVGQASGADEVDFTDIFEDDL